MKREHAMTICLAAGLILLPVARAVVSAENPYKNIIDRNPFGLVPPPPPDNTPPPSNIKISGITTLLGAKYALLVAQEPGPGKQPQYLTLSEGQREGAVEVISIDSVAGSVKINNAGSVSTLTFEKDGLKAAAAPPAPPAPGAPVAIPSRPGMPTHMPVPASSQPTPSGGFGAPQPSPSGGGNPAVGSQPGFNNGLRQIPTRSLRMPQSSAQINNASQPSDQAQSPEERIVNQAVEMLHNQDQIQQSGFPAPPTPELPF